MIKNKKILIIICVIVLVSVVAFLIYFFFLKEGNFKEIPLTENEQIEILNKLEEGADNSLDGIKKQEDTLKSLGGAKTEDQVLTDEEKQKMMNSFNEL